jgi:hypothetical protein
MDHCLRRLGRAAMGALIMACGSPFTAGSGSDGGAGGDGASQEGAASDSGGVPVIVCGGTPCLLDTHTCCVDTNGGMATCETGSTCPNQSSLAVHCKFRQDCPMSQVCCLSQQSMNVIKCENQCSGGDQQVCDPQLANSCPPNQQCKSDPGGGLNLPSNLGVCGG